MRIDEIQRFSKMQEGLIKRSEIIGGSLLPIMLEERERILRSVMGPAYHTQYLGRIIESYHGTQQSLSALVHAGLEGSKWQRLLADFEGTSDLMRSYRQTLSVPSEIWGSSLSSAVQSMQTVRLAERNAHLADRLLEPFNSYSGFARDTLTRIVADPESDTVAALSGSLVLAEEQVTSAAALIEATMGEAINDAEEVEAEWEHGDDGGVEAIALLQTQQAELLLVRTIPDGAAYDDLLILSPTARLAQTARRIGQHIVDCNELARGSGKDDIFKLTNALLEAQNHLAWVVAADKTSLGRIVDYLYTMLYESAGKDNLRYLAYVSKEDCDIVWTLKHLRNKWLRHDPEHGDGNSIRKSFIQRAEAFRSLRLSGQPTSPEEFQKLQAKLYEQIEELLEHLKARIKAS